MKTRKTIALLTVGHSPREDIVPELSDMLNQSFSIIHKGALDDFSPEEAAERFAPFEGEATMVSRLSDGKMGTFSAAKVMPFLQGTITAVCAEGCLTLHKSLHQSFVFCSLDYPILCDAFACSINPYGNACRGSFPV